MAITAERSRRDTDRLPESSADAGFTLIQPHVQVVGEVIAEETVRVAGRVQGRVSSRTIVIVERTGSVHGDVAAHHVIVEGSVEGNVRASGKFELRLTGRVRGDVQAPAIALAVGSFLHGKVIALEREPIRFREKRRRPSIGAS